MMILFFLTVLFVQVATFVVSVNQQSFEGFELRYPEDVGVVHTVAFAVLADMYRVERPVDRRALMSDAGDVSASLLCGGGYGDIDVDCRASARRINEEHFARARVSSSPSSPERSKKTSPLFRYPADLDPALADVVLRAHDLVAALSDGRDTSIDEVVGGLVALRREVENLSVVEHEGHRLAVICGLSVAAESSTLWHAVYRDDDNDEEGEPHVLRGMHSEHYFVRDGETEGEQRRRRRRLEDAVAGALVSNVVVADVAGGTEAALQAVTNGGVLDVQGVITSAAMGAFSASVSALIGDDEDSMNEDEYSDDESLYGYVDEDADSDDSEDDDDGIATFDFDDVDDDDDDACTFEVPFVC